MHSHQILKTHPGARADTHTVTQMHAQMHMQRYKWDFTLGGTLQHEHNRVFLAGFVLLNSPLFFPLVYFYSRAYIILQMLSLFCLFRRSSPYGNRQLQKKKGILGAQWRPQFNDWCIGVIILPLSPPYLPPPCSGGVQLCGGQLGLLPVQGPRGQGPPLRLVRKQLQAEGRLSAGPGSVPGPRDPRGEVADARVDPPNKAPPPPAHWVIPLAALGGGGVRRSQSAITQRGMGTPFWV